jgi:hypothetical protein
MPYQKEAREANTSYLAHIRRQPCCVCGDDVHVEAHHPRYGVGMADKASDRDAVPLCGRHHRELHATGSEREFWASRGIDPHALALRYQILVR